MVTAQHEALHRIFQERREMVAPALRLLNVSLPQEPAVQELSPDCTEIQPVERRADTVVCVSPPGRRGFVLAIESQGRKDKDKPYSWAHYASFLMAKFGLPAQLLVLCSNAATAKWAQGPFPLGLEGHETLTVSPWVLGPDNVPLVTDAREAAQNVPVAVLSALVHRGDAAREAILEALAHALTAVADEDDAKHYMFMVDAGLDASAREIWRTFVSSYFPGGGPLLEWREREIRAEGEAEGEARGEARGEANAILRVFEGRGISVSDAVRARVTACTDLAMLDRWLSRVATVAHAEDLFTEDDR